MSAFDANDWAGGMGSGSPSDNNGGGAPAGAGSGDPNTPAGGGTPGGNDQQQPPPGREDWIPRTRFDEVNGQVGTLRSEIARLQALDEQRQNIGRQLMGQQPQAPEDPVVARVREQLLQVFPELGILRELGPQLRNLPAHMSATEATEQAFHRQLGLQHMNAIEAVAAPVFGLDKLSQDQKSYLQGQFIDWLSRDKGLQSRYMAGDTSIGKEFMSFYQATFLDPFRRTQMESVQQRAGMVGRLPSRAPTAAPLPGARPPQPQTEEERHDAAFEAFQQAMGR